MSLRVDINVELLIALVKARPVIWDVFHEKYKDRIKTSEAWSEIFIQLYPDFEELDAKEKLIYSKDVVKKWTNVRDSYRKAYRRNCSAGESKSKSYIYDSQMQFLNEVLKNRRGRARADSSSTDIEQSERVFENEESLNQSSLDSSPSHEIKKSKEHINLQNLKNKKRLSKKRKPYSYSSIELEVNRKTAHTEFEMNRKTADTELEMNRKSDHIELEMSRAVREIPNQHQSFFNGIIPFLENFHEFEVLEFQMEVLKIIQSIKQRRQNATSNAS